MSWKFYRVQDYKKNLIIWSSFVIFSLIFFISINLSETKKINNEKNLKEVTSSNDFSSFTEYLFSRINSPYVEVNYKIKNNDSIEKILKKFNIEAIDIKKISIKLKKKNLPIYTLVDNFH